jgi:hypothetical protein
MLGFDDEKLATFVTVLPRQVTEVGESRLNFEEVGADFVFLVEVVGDSKAGFVDDFVVAVGVEFSIGEMWK